MAAKTLAVFMLLVPAAAWAEAPAPAQVTGVDLVHCGVYQSRVDRREDDRGAASGHRTIVADNKLVVATTRIEAHPGSKFGCGIVLHGSPEGETAQFRAVLHRPSGEAMSGSQQYRIGSEGFVGFTFKDERAIQPGDWKLVIEVSGRRLAERVFTVTRQ